MVFVYWTVLVNKSLLIQQRIVKMGLPFGVLNKKAIFVNLIPMDRNNISNVAFPAIVFLLCLLSGQKKNIFPNLSGYDILMLISGVKAMFPY